MEESTVNVLLSAAESAQWTVLAGAILMALIWVFQRLTTGRLPQSALPVANAVIGLAAAIATILLTGVGWWRALALGLLTGAAAGGFWSMVGKHLLPLTPQAPAEQPPEGPANAG